MLTIGDIAHRTGTSRRMLRHWEAEGLLSPAAIDPVSGYRRYTDAQAGRVHAIAALRSLGFGLEEIRDLLDPTLTTPRLLESLRTREDELARRIEADRVALGEVQRRLRSIEEGLQMTIRTLQLHPLPPTRLAQLSTSVRDESEIGHAVVDLSAQVRTRMAAAGRPWDGSVVRTYEAAPGNGPITVAVGIEIPDGEPPAGLVPTVLAAEPEGASITYDGALTDEADAWRALDAALEPHGLVTGSRYRVLVTPSTVTLQAPVAGAGNVTLPTPRTPRRECDRRSR
ncbi:MerR family transcriptional regulator [Pseudactinotalea terrae]|uniref:MerR family transcriptional regulator n=1 Tax=Pseudactinotalea terrae TaxID=1743262 RepID=UPI001390B8FD|nr:MerR family transcriptional regulator [Pseudactinotalea terrae]